MEEGEEWGGEKAKERVGLIGPIKAARAASIAGGEGVFGLVMVGNGLPLI